MVYTHVAAAIVSASLAAWGAWQVQAWRYDSQVAAMQKAHAESMQKAEQAARRQEHDLLTARQKAEEQYELEKRKAAGAATRARAELDGLRNELYAIGPSTAGKSAPATGRADGAARIEGELLGQCATALVAVAAEADRLAANVIGLQSYVKGVCLSPP